MRSSRHTSLRSVVFSIVWKRVSSLPSLALLRNRMLLRTRSTSAMMPPAIITGTPPRCMRHTTIPAPMNATPAVMNQPPITEMTPVMRNTALSRPQALSASDVPIATMNVTNVVESGSFIDVPQAISIPAIIRFTAPRTRSNAAPSSGWDFDESRRRLMTRFRP